MPVPRLTEQALQAIATHPLTGNVRELENVLHRAVALTEGDELQVEAFSSGCPTAQGSAHPAATSQPPQTPHKAPYEPPSSMTAHAGAEQDGAGTAPLPNDLQAWLDQQERDILIRALKETGFNRTATAARLGISLRQIRYRIARLNIGVPNDQDFQDEIG